MITSEDVRAGMERGELFVQYLPTVMLADARCIGAEALVRWKRDRVVLSGGEFIPLIENTPMSGTIMRFYAETRGDQLPPAAPAQGKPIAPDMPSLVLRCTALSGVQQADRYIRTRTG